MKERVDVREWIEFQWPYLVTFVGGKERVEELAYATGAFSRPRKVADPETLLRLLLMWTVGEQSLMDTAALAAEAELVDVSDAALIKRFHKCGDWLGGLLGEVLIEQNANLPRGLRVRVIDATTISRGGSRGTDHRVHLGVDLGSNRIDSAELTAVTGGETFDRFSFRAGEILVAEQFRLVVNEMRRRLRISPQANSRYYWPHFLHDQKWLRRKEQNHVNLSDAFLEKHINSEEALTVAMKSAQDAHSVRYLALMQFVHL